MYDFCFTYPYAFLLALGGIVGYLHKGSIVSLGGGVGSGALLFVLAYISLKKYRSGKLWKLGTLLCLLISVGLTIMMFSRYMTTGKFFPAGAVMALSGSMSVFYTWSLFLGPQPKKKEAA